MKSALVVDDSETTRSLITSTIEDIGNINTFESSSGFEALKVLPTRSFDLIVIDINMPDINGLELLNFLKNNDQYKDIPVLIVSTESSEEDKEKGMNLGAYAYITKPFKTEMLQDIVKKALDL